VVRQVLEERPFSDAKQNALLGGPSAVGFVRRLGEDGGRGAGCESPGTPERRLALPGLVAFEALQHLFVRRPYPPVVMVVGSHDALLSVVSYLLEAQEPEEKTSRAFIPPCDGRIFSPAARRSRSRARRPSPADGGTLATPDTLEKRFRHIFGQPARSPGRKGGELGQPGEHGRHCAGCRDGQSPAPLNEREPDPSLVAAGCGRPC
jgi:hypothetical protein